MRIINGINYYYKLNEMIKECLQQARLHPFEQYYFIVEDCRMVEKLFLKQTCYLVNVEILTYKQYLQKLIINNHLTQYHLMNNIELTYYLRQIFNELDLHCFHISSPYPIINEMIPLMKEIELNQTIYHINSDKLEDYMNIYHALKSKTNHYLCLESILFNHISDNNNHLYIEADHITSTLQMKLIEQLSNNNDITLMYTHSFDDRLFNIHLNDLCKNAYTIDNPNYLLDNLFQQNIHKEDIKASIYTFHSATPQNEVKRVVYHILEKIVDEKLHYQDFIITYSDNLYQDLLLDILESLHIPHNIPKTSSWYYEKDYKDIINYLDNHELELPINEYEQLFHDLDNKYIEYFKTLKDFHEVMTSEEFKEFFINTYKYSMKEVFDGTDCIQVVPIEKLKSDKPKYIYILGMNETILPKKIKDTGLLLDEDIELLRSHDISTPPTSLERLGMVYNDILKALQTPYITLTISYSLSNLGGETKLPSSLYHQLEGMYEMLPLPTNKYLSLEGFYLQGGKLSHKDILNHHITHYTENKNQPGYLSQEVINQLYSSTLSVSQIETYNKCPYLYFIQYGLGIHERKDNTLMPSEIGSLVHYVLSQAMKRECYVDDVVNYYLDNNQELKDKITGSHVNSYFINEVKKNLNIIIPVLHSISDHSLFTIKNEEEKIEDEIAGIHFKGFVDRIDEHNNTISIIDYKSSAKDIDLKLAAQGFNIQMLLYLKMVTHLYNKDPGAVLYFNTKKRALSSKEAMNDDIKKEDFYNLYKYGGYVIDDGNEIIKAIDPDMGRKSNVVNITYVKSKDAYKGNLMDNATLNELLNNIEKHIQELYQAMQQGHIDIIPKDSPIPKVHMIVNACRYCKYHSICHFDNFYNECSQIDIDNTGGDDSGI